MLIAIEGVDGAGKRTLSRGLQAAFEARGKSVASLAFPRYGQSVTADVAGEALRGQHGDLASSAYAMALLFALDRAGAAAEIEKLRGDYDVVILDRYVASNAAYSAARLRQDATGEVVAWVYDVEYRRLHLPMPDYQVLLDVSTELAGQRARSRAVQEAGRDRDAYERDDLLQQRTGVVYAGLAAAGWGGRWQVVGADVDPGKLAALLLAE
ncbi:thymidylate kinase [Mycobacterium heckeshornense]|uniref:Thymidylate kinase n=1 Tax=Mycobacterium heckeshornense TaxID=110505 RepID=A0A2G8B840_9MYCO|nr:dTMP kinase [Mycobacterium heckeshornense]KMV21079.1 thymidylate kinase [Mycobacterium heckeshornense]MCV7036729.1 dTMP kinase [Mycobacterium heckeshornense]PIJ33933.1 thymidylate kinase [Mycobacterium heckeshornense]BCO37301.1 thymidylate kinase [Mycobacterium heckeshornense]BCQ10182.1 thymidylate kinase [Mycobacterium heckeshornense]